MYIRADSNGNIQLVSIHENIDCAEFTGKIPDDFYETVGLGKYIFIDGEIVEVDGWVMPVIESQFKKK